MRRRRAARHVLPALLALLLWPGLGGRRPAAAQPPQSPAGVMAAFSFEPPDAPRVGAKPTATPGIGDIRLGSRYVPAECRSRAELGDPTLLDCWLEHFPTVAAAIRWEFVDARGRHVRSWPEWDEAARAGVRNAFVHAREWHATGMKAWNGPLAGEPPVNREAAHVGGTSIATTFDGGTAWILFSAHVGLSLAAEIDGWVPWSIRSYEFAALEDLFDAPGVMFRYDRDDGGPDDTVFPGYSPLGTVTPTHPTVSHRFLRENRLLGDSPLATITAVLEWSRRHLRRAPSLGDRAEADESPRARALAFWQYEGKAPLVALLGGTRVAGTRWQALHAQPEHWTDGCAMTTDAYVWLLRAANVPVRRAGSRASCSHVAPFFSAEGLYLSDGDDPYDPMMKTFPYTAEALLVRSALWKAWFPDGGGKPWCWNVGRRVVDLNRRFPSDHLVGLHCEDVLAATPRDQSRVLAAFRGLYPQRQLETEGLWVRLGELASASTADACVRLRAGR